MTKIIQTIAVALALPVAILVFTFALVVGMVAGAGSTVIQIWRD